MSLHTFCNCCLKILGHNDSRIPVNDKTKEIFFKLIRYPIKPGHICGKCNINLLTFDAFQREVRRKHNLATLDGGEEQQKTNEEVTEVVKKIKQEDPIDINDGTEFVVTEQVPSIHKSLPVENRRRNYIDVAIKSIKDGQRLAATIRHKNIVRNSFRVPLVASKTFSSSSIGEDFPNTSTVTQTPQEGDDEDVIVLPPEPPIDLDNLSENVKQKPKEKMFKCGHCIAVSTKRELIVAHIKNSHSFACLFDGCGKNFPTEDKMHEHMEKNHTVVKYVAAASSGGHKRKQHLVAKDESDEINFRLKAKPYGRPVPGRKLNHEENIWMNLIDSNPKTYHHITLKFEPEEGLNEAYQTYRDLVYERITAGRFMALQKISYPDCDIQANKIFDFHKSNVKFARFDYCNWEFVAENSMKLENLERLDMQCIEFRSYQGNVLNLPNLKQLNAYGVLNVFEVIAPKVEKLKVVFGSLTNEILEGFPNLKHFEFMEAEWKNEDVQLTALPQNLVTLDFQLIQNSQVEIDLIKLMEINRKSLRNLRLITDNRQNEIEFAMYETNVEKLEFNVPKKFKFQEKVNQSVKSLILGSYNSPWTSKIFQSLPNVECLTLENSNQNLEGQILIAAVDLLPKLKSLSIKDGEICDFEVIDLSSIESLTLRPIRLDQDGYVNLILSCPNLRKLQDLQPYYANALNEENLLKILKNLKNLEEISSNYVVELSDKVVEFLTSNEVKLKRIKLVVDKVHFEKQKELSLRLARGCNIQCTVTEK